MVSVHLCFMTLTRNLTDITQSHLSIYFCAKIIHTCVPCVSIRTTGTGHFLFAELNFDYEEASLIGHRIGKNSIAAENAVKSRPM